MPPVLSLTGERQVATDIDQIAKDHIKRYEFAADYIENEMDIQAQVLDAACGNGYGSYVIALNTGAQVTGLEISQDAVDCAVQHYSLADLTRYEKVDFVDGSIPHSKHESGMYDCIVCFETLEHMAKPEILLQKFLEVGNTMICSVPNEDVVPYEHANHPFHFRHYTVEKFEELLNDCGWRVTEWFTQYSKQEGDVYEADDGKTLIVVAEKVVE